MGLGKTAAGWLALSAGAPSWAQDTVKLQGLRGGTPVTQDNLQAVIDAGVITQEALCQGVTAGSVAACP